MHGTQGDSLAHAVILNEVKNPVGELHLYPTGFFVVALLRMTAWDTNFTFRKAENFTSPVILERSEA